MKSFDSLPLWIAPEVAEYLKRRLQGTSTKGMVPVIYYSERGWIGDTFVGEQVILGYVTAERQPESEKFRLGEYDVLVPTHSITQLRGKALVFERVELPRSPKPKQVRLIRVRPRISQ
jgi:hypothetical protein